MKKTPAILLGTLVVVLGFALSAVFIVDPREKALVVQFGEIKQVIEKPGLYFKLPVVQDVVRYDGRILGLPTQPLEITPLDDRRLVVDAFARWRIVDLVRFREATGVEGVSFAQHRLENILNATTRQVLGSVPSNAVLSEDRTALMNQIRDLARSEANSLGVDVIDVRLTRTDLPEQNLSATYDRMRAERQREATDEIARGNEAAQRVRASADRTALELTSKARKQADVIRGEADAESNRVYAKAFDRDPEFFAFTRSLTAYETALKGDNSTMVLRPDSEFFDYLRSDKSSSLPRDVTLVPLSPAEKAAQAAAQAAANAAAVAAQNTADADAAADAAADVGTASPDASTSGNAAGQTGAGETGTSETGTSETGTSKTGTSKTGAGETGASGTGVNDGGAAAPAGNPAPTAPASGN